MHLWLMLALKFIRRSTVWLAGPSQVRHSNEGPGVVVQVGEQENEDDRDEAEVNRAVQV
jgi:hypothetical protein